MSTLKYRVLHGGPLPPFIDVMSKSPAEVCRLAKSPRKVNAVTITVNGAKLTMQAVAARKYLDVAEELKSKDILIRPISSHRTCADQARACDGICGRGCAGCPGLCAPCGQSGHQSCACCDSHIAKHPGRSYAEAYQVYKHAMLAHGFDNFDGWENGSDSMHVSYHGAY